MSSNHDHDLRLRLDAITSRLREFRLRAEHQVGDAYVFLCCTDVVRFSTASLLLAASDDPATAVATARSAYEAALDGLYLMTSGTSFDQEAAMAYAHDLLDTEKLRTRLATGGSALGATLSTEGRPTAADVIGTEAERLDREHAGLGDALRRAADRIRAEPRTYRSWSGKSKNDMAKALDTRSPDLPAIGGGLDALYGTMSARTHPRFRSFERQLEVRDDGTLAIRPSHAADDFALRLCQVAATLALEALDRRLQDAG